MSDGPITKANLLSALESMQSGKSKRQDISWWESQITEHKVDFNLTKEDKRKIRQHGDYLGRNGLDKLIVTIQRNRYKTTGHIRVNKPPAQPSSVNQSITNSPGSILAGRDVIINQGRAAITPEQRDAMRSVLREHPSTVIYILTFQDTEDTRTLANQITETFISSGWKDVKTIPYMGLSFSHRGIYVFANDPDIRRLLASAFTKANIALSEVGPAFDNDYPNSIAVAIR